MQRIRYSVIGLVVALLVTPLALSAQTTGDIQAQIQQLLSQVRDLQQQLQALRASSTATSTPPLGTRHRVCLMARTLGEGEAGQDVQALQEFLREQGFFDTNATGFFGPVTRNALMEWQARNAIVSSGNAATTGWGVFGPRTRAFIARWCASVGQTAPPQNGATSTTSSNQPPTIVSFTGPSTLIVGTEGTWAASSTDPEGDPIMYRVSWGDAGAQAVLWELAGLDDGAFGTTTTFTHTYNRAGVYAVTLRVKDDSGGTAMVTRLVQVSQAGGSGVQRLSNVSEWLNILDAVQNQNAQNDQGDQDTDNEGDNANNRWTDRDMIQCLTGLKESGNVDFSAVENCLTPKSSDGSCWFNGLWVRSGSWVTAYEKSGTQLSYGEACKMEVRTCNNGTLSGSYKAGTCTPVDLTFGNPG